MEDLTTLVEMAAEEDDASLLPEVEEGYGKLESSLEEAKLATLLTGEYDANNAILTLHAGAGGTEAQDWCQMLFRMYTRWAEAHDFTWKTLDYEPCDDAGIKSATISIEGENAYGFLKSENGVHRLVRISPFDANARRQTSFSRWRSCGDRRRQLRGDPSRGHRDAGLPLLRRRRPAREQDPPPPCG